jgi:hypothetical protein
VEYRCLCRVLLGAALLCCAVLQIRGRLNGSLPQRLEIRFGLLRSVSDIEYFAGVFTMITGEISENTDTGRCKAIVLFM